jgi:S-adenosylmethionine:tRNA ribosyltransferase-isomerase
VAPHLARATLIRKTAPGQPVFQGEDEKGYPGQKKNVCASIEDGCLHPKKAGCRQQLAIIRLPVLPASALSVFKSPCLRTDLFDYELPEECIALRPANPRDSARLLVVKPGEPFGDQVVTHLPQFLRAGDILAINNTKVISAALSGKRIRGELIASVSFNLLRRVDDNRWTALARPAKKLEIGDSILFGHESNVCLLGSLSATISGKGGAGEVELTFDLSGPDLDQALEAIGDMPLPPYIAGKRPPDAADRMTYQTIFAVADGAVAAPTAGLHFTPQLVECLQSRGVKLEFVTLHVGAGTFLPVKTDDTCDHKMHAEWGEISAEAAAALNAARAKGGRIVAVGTTSLRLLESAASDDGEIRPFRGETGIFITPGYTFKAADILITNFHLPRSTLLMLVSAFSGMETIRKAYQHALAAGYRFYSYGDACLLFPERPLSAT